MRRRGFVEAYSLISLTETLTHAARRSVEVAECAKESDELRNRVLQAIRHLKEVVRATMAQPQGASGALGTKEHAALVQIRDGAESGSPLFNCILVMLGAVREMIHVIRIGDDKDRPILRARAMTACLGRRQLLTEVLRRLGSSRVDSGIIKPRASLIKCDQS